MLIEYRRRNQTFKLTLDSYDVLCIVIPLHYDKDYSQTGLHFTGYMHSHNRPKTDEMHFYVEDNQISHITKRTVEVLF